MSVILTSTFLKAVDSIHELIDCSLVAGDNHLFLFSPFDVTCNEPLKPNLVADILARKDTGHERSQLLVVSEIQ